MSVYRYMNSRALGSQKIVLALLEPELQTFVNRYQWMRGTSSGSSKVTLHGGGAIPSSLKLCL